MELPDPNNSFGLRLVDSMLQIGNFPVSVVENTLFVNNEEFEITSGLKQLLFKSKPVAHDMNDLISYKNILSLTSAHKRRFDTNGFISSSRSWKYLNVISKLFPTRRGCHVSDDAKDKNY